MASGSRYNHSFGTILPSSVLQFKLEAKPPMILVILFGHKSENEKLRQVERNRLPEYSLQQLTLKQRKWSIRAP